MNIFKRALLWTISFYVISTVAIFYLTAKEKLQNFDALFYLLPLLIAGIGTEVSNKKYKKTKFYVLGYINTVVELLAFICAVLIYNKTATGVWYYLCLAIFFACAIVSIVLTILIMRCEKSYFDTLNKQTNDTK